VPAPAGLPELTGAPFPAVPAHRGRYNGRVTPGAQGVCPRCAGTEWVLEQGRAVRCGCFRERRNRRLLEDAGIPARYDHCTLEGYLPRTPMQRAVLERTRAFVEAFPVAERGLLYLGACGVGKTHLAVAALRVLVREKGARGRFEDYQDLLRRIQSSYSADAQTSEAEVLRPVLEAEVLLLDDLGGARRPTPWVFDTLFHVLNTRYNERRVTLITSNFEDIPYDRLGGREAVGQDSLQDRVGERLHSRLYEMCEVLPIQGPDFRRKEARERGR
jgi:DNA replication protein DnaC